MGHVAREAPASVAIESYYLDTQGEKQALGTEVQEYFCVEHPNDDIHVVISPLGTNPTNMVYVIGMDDNPSPQPRHIKIIFRQVGEIKSDKEVTVTITQEGKPA